MNNLPNDVARCDGVSYTEDGQIDWREGCETCLRRTAPRPKLYPMIQPPPIIAFECEFLIEPKPENLWCANCAKWGNHTSGSCPDLTH